MAASCKFLPIFLKIGGKKLRMSKKKLICDAAKFNGECVERKITISKSISGTINGNLRIPINLLKFIGVTEDNRVVTIVLEDDKLIVGNLNNKRNLVKEDFVEITQEEKKYLLMHKSKDTLVQYIKKEIHNLFSRREL